MHLRNDKNTHQNLESNRMEGYAIDGLAGHASESRIHRISNPIKRIHTSSEIERIKPSRRIEGGKSCSEWR